MRIVKRKDSGVSSTVTRASTGPHQGSCQDIKSPPITHQPRRTIWGGGSAGQKNPVQLREGLFGDPPTHTHIGFGDSRGALPPIRVPGRGPIPLQVVAASSEGKNPWPPHAPHAQVVAARRPRGHQQHRRQQPPEGRAAEEEGARAPAATCPALGELAWGTPYVGGGVRHEGRGVGPWGPRLNNRRQTDQYSAQCEGSQRQAEQFYRTNRPKCHFRHSLGEQFDPL